MKRISFSDFRSALLAHAGDKSCFKAIKYFGSFLAFNFGARHKTTGRKGDRIGYVGAFELVVRDCAWTIYDQGVVMTDSFAVGIKDDGDVRYLLQNRRLIDFRKIGANTFSFDFDSDLSLQFHPHGRDSTVLYNTALIEIYARDESYVDRPIENPVLVVSSKGYLFECVAEK